MADHIRLYTRGANLISLLAGIMCIVFCLNVVSNQAYQRNGLAIIHFNIPHLDLRDVSLSVPTKPPSIPDVIPSVTVPDISPIETALGSMIPQNCTLGIEYFCTGLTNRIDCQSLPLNLSSIIPSSLQASGIRKLDHALSQVTSSRIKTCLATGAAFATLATGISIWTLLSSRNLGISIRVIGGVSSVICSIPLLVATILYSLCANVKLPSEIKLETGVAARQILAALIFAELLGASFIFGSVIGRYGEHLLS